jgi:hypothetical protein
VYLSRPTSHNFLLYASPAGAEEQDFYEQIPIILRELLYRLNDEDATVLTATNGALAALSKHVPAEELVNHIEFIRNLIASTVSDARRRKGGVGDGVFLMPGFNIPKGKRARPKTTNMSNVMIMHIYASTRPICVGLRLVFQIANLQQASTSLV